MVGAELGLRERKKLRTRQAVTDAAVRLFAEKGFDATTVEEICERAEVSPSTFFRYFESKEAAAFPEEEPRVRIVEDALRARPADEPFNVSIRRAALALLDYDIESGKNRDVDVRMDLLAREPALAVFSTRMQARAAERFTAVVAELLGADAATDLRPRLLVNLAFAAVNSAWATLRDRGPEEDLRALTVEAFDVLDEGLASLLA